MKVRHRQTSVEVSGCTPQGKDFVNTLLNLYLTGDEWEQIDPPLAPKPATWRDVTGECEQRDSGYLLWGGNVCVAASPTYRLRKVHLGKFPDYDMRHPNFVWQDCFVIERKD